MEKKFLSAQDYAYWERLASRHTEIQRLIGVLEIQKAEMVQVGIDLLKERNAFEKQIYEKYDLDLNKSFNVNSTTLEIIQSVPNANHLKEVMNGTNDDESTKPNEEGESENQ